MAVSKTDDRDIQRAVAVGERNRSTMELIHNWCAHASVKKMGGVGLIEAQTGLPIGHHAMVCDHAAAGGMATWDLADAALDFHDRNCVDCKLRAPVRLPNLTTLLRERELGHAEEQRRRTALEEQRARALDERQAARHELRAKVDVASTTVIDQLEDLDRDRTDECRNQLVETARLAPEIFSPDIIEHFFSLLEAGETWFSGTGLEILLHLKADPVRLTRCALVALTNFTAAEIASKIVQTYITHVETSLISGALRSLVLLADPPRLHFTDTSRLTLSAPLLALYRSYPAEVRAAIQTHLDERQFFLVRTAANAIVVIGEDDPNIAVPFSRSLIAKLARAELLIDFDQEGRRNDEQELFRNLQDALELALKAAPQATDTLVANFMQMASAETQARLLEAYNDLFRGASRDEEIVETGAHAVALSRLITTVTSTNDYDVLRAVLDILRNGPPTGLEGLVRRELTRFLGAAPPVST